MASRPPTHFHEAFSHFLERRLPLSSLPVSPVQLLGGSGYPADVIPAETHWAQLY